MVSTRASRRQATLEDGKKAKTRAPRKENVEEEEEEEEEAVEPKPISSSSEDEEASVQEEESSTTNSALQEEENASSPLKQRRFKGESRLFAPYNSLGIVTSGRPYCLTHTGDSSQTSFCTLPIGNRFHVYQCDRLFPVLVSRAVPKGGSISHVQSDASLEITVASHGGRHVTLYSRTRPIDTLTLASKQYNAVDMLHVGKIQIPMHGEKEGKMENAAVICLVLKKLVEDEGEGVPVVGNDSDGDDSSSDEDSDGDSDSDSTSSFDSNENDDMQGSGQVVLVLASRTNLQVQNRIALPTSFGTPTVALHPSTYLNKIVVGSNKGLLLLNVRTSKIIYKFNSIQQHVSALEQSPAVDTIAAGTKCGNVHLLNLKHDAILFSLLHKTEITSLSFRTDGSAMRYGIAPLAVGRTDGTISVWDLQPNEDSDERTLLTELKQVHPGGVAKLSFMPQEPLLVSTGLKSNSIQMHVFDSPDHSARLLRQRSGHTAPPTCIKYKYNGSGLLHQSIMDGSDAAAFQVLSGSKDCTLREFSSARSVLDKEYSQGKGLLKKAKQLAIDKKELLLPPIVDIVTCEAKSRDWGDLVTIHQNHAMAYVWSTRRGAQSGPVLRQPNWNVSAMQVPPPKTAHATSVAISACGNYCLVGTQGGIIYKYNIQSGIPRGTYPLQDDAPKEVKKRSLAGDVNRTMRALTKGAKLSNRSSNQEKMEQEAAVRACALAIQKQKLLMASHTGHAVTGLAVDSLNKTLVSVGMDSKLILWNFQTRAPHKRSPYKLPAPATKLCHVRDSNMAAIALEDYTVVLFDCSALAIVRRFGNAEAIHSGPISGVDLSPDGRSLFSASLDGTVRVWDVPTSTCVDWLAFKSPPTSLTVSPTGEFFATTHADRLGISLWSDKSFYQSVNIDGAHSPAEPARMDDPVPIAQESNDDDKREAAVLINKDTTIIKGRKQPPKETEIAPPAKQEGLITMSGLPPAHWKNLFHLELVKERNKPKEAPKKPPSAPFFLQWRGDALGHSTKKGNAAGDDNEEWAAAWSDDDDAKKSLDVEKQKAELDSKKKGGRETADGGEGNKNERELVATTSDWIVTRPKKRKVAHARSNLAALLDQCQERASADGLRFQAVTEHMATLGPSAIDVAFSTLCNGMHDLEEGLPLLHLTSMWLLEACQSRQRYEAVNAYLHRFLYLHSNVIAGIDDSIKQEQDEPQTEEERNEKEQERQQRVHLLETITQLRVAQRAASDALRAKMQHSLCLLRHFSRMV